MRRFGPWGISEARSREARPLFGDRLSDSQQHLSLPAHSTGPLHSFLRRCSRLCAAFNVLAVLFPSLTNDRWHCRVL